MVNKNVRVNKRKYRQKKKPYKAKEKLGIVISICGNDINIGKVIRKSARQNIKIVEFMEFNNDPLEDIQQFVGLINIITRYQRKKKSVILMIQKDSYDYLTQLIIAGMSLNLICNKTIITTLFMSIYDGSLQVI